MKTYITAGQVDEKLGLSWAPADQKSRAVMIANVWLSNQGLPDIDSIPDEWVQAGAEIAKEAAQGKIYGAKEVGLLSKSATAGEVSSSKTYAPNAKALTAGESLALALIKPWLPNGLMVKLVRA